MNTTDDILDDNETNPFKSDSNKNSKAERHKREVAAAISDGWVVASSSSAGTQLKKEKTMRPVTVFLAILAGISVFFSFVAAIFFAVLAACNQSMSKEKTKFIQHG